MSGETGRRRKSRAAHFLDEAPRSRCPHCNRDSATVSGGICADCWGVKDPENAIDFSPPPKTDPLVGWDWSLFGLEPEATVAWIAAAVIAVVVAVLLAVS